MLKKISKKRRTMILSLLLFIPLALNISSGLGYSDTGWLYPYSVDDQGDKFDHDDKIKADNDGDAINPQVHSYGKMKLDCNFGIGEVSVNYIYLKFEAKFGGWLQWAKIRLQVTHFGETTTTWNSGYVALGTGYSVKTVYVNLNNGIYDVSELVIVLKVSKAVLATVYIDYAQVKIYW